MSFAIVDLFSGIGGLSLGFEMAGCVCLAGVEHNVHHKEAFAQLHRSASTRFDDVAALTGRALLREIGLSKGELDVLVGGPPCQPFSTAGKRRGTKDFRGKLVDEFVRLVQDVRPRAFVMENVVGLASIHDGRYLRTILRRLNDLGYAVESGRGLSVLNAADYGVPQVRRRLFLVGLRGPRHFEFPKPTHCRPNKPGELPLKHGASTYLTVGDAIGDLPNNGRQADDPLISDALAVPYVLQPQNDYQSVMRGRRRKVTGNGVSVHQPHIVDAITLEALPHGAEDPSTRYRRLYPDRPSFTLRAGSGTFTALRPIHPFRPRVITVREAARLQSFPDNVQFSSIKQWAYQQIGNSVPPLLARAIGARLADFLS